MTRLFWLCCAAYAAAWVWAWQALPARVPLHFGLGGGADRIGSRTEALVTFAAVGVGVALVLGLSLLAVRRARWQWLNVPHKGWWTATPERQRRLRRMVGVDAGAISAGTMLLLAVLLLGTVVAAREPELSLPWWFFTALGCYLVGITAAVVWMYARRYRPDDGEPA